MGDGLAVVWVRVGCEFSVCEAGAVVWGYLGPLGAGTALLVVLVCIVLPVSFYRNLKLASPPLSTRWPPRLVLVL